MTKSKNLRHIERCLAATGLPWSIENGGKHKKIILAGKFIAVMTQCGNAGRGRDTLQHELAIQKRVKEVKCS